MINANLYKRLLLLGTIGGVLVSNACAMEKDKKSTRTDSDGGIAMREQSEIRLTEDQLLSLSFQAMEMSCMDSISKGTSAKSQEDRIHHFLDCLKLLEPPFLSYKQHFEGSDFSRANKSLAIQAFYRVTTTLFQEWSKNIGKASRLLDNSLFNFLVLLTDVDSVVFKHFEFLNPAEIPSIHINLATFNFLTHITTTFISYNDRLIDDNQRKTLVRFATAYFNKVKVNPKDKDEALNYLKAIQKKQEEWELLQRPVRFVSKAISAKRAQNRFAIQREALDLTAKAQELSAPHSSKEASHSRLGRMYHEIIALKNIASTEWDAHHDTARYVAYQRESYQKILQLESELANVTDLPPSTPKTSDFYRALYTELQKETDDKDLRKRLEEFVTICQAVGDLEGANLRVHAFVQIVGGSSQRFEDVPNDFKYIFALINYWQGNPEPWDLFTKKLEAEKEKRKAARKKQKAHTQEKGLSSAPSILDDEKTLPEAPKQIEEKQLKQVKAPVTKDQLRKADPDYDMMFTDEKKETPKAEAKRLAEKALERESDRLEKKRGKKANLEAQADEVIAQATTAPRLPTASEKDTIEIKLSSATRKLYENLYSLHPQLESDDAVQLLLGLGLSIDYGKGSHTVLTFNSGEVIKDAQGNVLWICPDLAENSLSTSIPKWDKKDIPFYMIKNLKYIIEKIYGKDFV